jgi:predicted restriction endonuclease
MKRTPLKRNTPLKVKGTIKKKAKRARRDCAPTTKHLDKLWADVVKLRCLHSCEMHGVAGRMCGNIMHAHHIFVRQHTATRWDLDNGMCLCAGHHLWTHDNPCDSTDEIKELIGLERYELIKERHYQVFKPTAQDRREIAARLRAELDRLQKERAA